MIDEIVLTVIKRPYVLLFLISYLIIASSKRGFPKTLFFLFVGYAVAWISEASSIRNGFPYGGYSYIYENLQGEWLNWGVPVWDSVSYVFLNYAAFCMAEKLITKASHFHDHLLRGFISACFVVLMDIVIDPLAHLGEQWFLGKIYFYHSPGYYFGVPVSNFIGWLLVGTILGVFASYLFEKKTKASFFRLRQLLNEWGGIALFYGILLFNWGITLYIGAYLLALFSLFWILVSGLPYWILKKRHFS